VKHIANQLHTLTKHVLDHSTTTMDNRLNCTSSEKGKSGNDDLIDDGSYIGSTEKDINARIGLTWAAFDQLKPVLRSPLKNSNLKIRFRMHLNPTMRVRDMGTYRGVEKQTRYLCKKSLP
jgi:hypothetical protein